MGTELLLILVGVILRANDTWFNGAHTVGTVCLVVGIVIAVVEAVVLCLVLAAGASVTRRPRRRR